MRKLHCYSLFKSAAALCCIGALVCLFAACPNGQTRKNQATVIVNVLDSVGGVPITEPPRLPYIRSVWSVHCIAKCRLSMGQPSSPFKKMNGMISV